MIIIIKLYWWELLLKASFSAVFHDSGSLKPDLNRSARSSQLLLHRWRLLSEEECAVNIWPHRGSVTHPRHTKKRNNAFFFFQIRQIRVGEKKKGFMESCDSNRVHGGRYAQRTVLLKWPLIIAVILERRMNFWKHAEVVWLCVG